MQSQPNTSNTPNNVATRFNNLQIVSRLKYRSQGVKQ